jgi:hypothetical protein
MGMTRVETGVNSTLSSDVSLIGSGFNLEQAVNRLIPGKIRPIINILILFSM